MKCSNCGFISSKPFYRCPYCGAIHESEENIFDRSLQFNNNLSIRLKTIIYIIVFNLLSISVLVDWYLGFQYGITFISYVLLVGIFVFINLFKSKRGIFSAIMGVDLYVLIGLLIGWCYYFAPSIREYVVYIPSLAIPSFIICSDIASAALLAFFAGKKKVRPLWFETVLLIHILVSTLIFVFFMICRYSMGVTPTPFDYLALGSSKGNITTLFILEEVLVFISFGLSVLYFINFNIVLIGRIFHSVKGFYGK